MALKIDAYVAAIKKYFDILWDSGLPETITWKVFQKSEFSQELKRNVETYSDFTIQAINTEKGWSWGQAGTVLVNKSRSNYLVRAADYPSGASTRDKIVSGGRARQVTNLINHFNVVIGVSLDGD